MATIRTERMVSSAPDYYQTSRIFEAIQAAQAAEYDSVDAKTIDLQNQLRIVTATWGLKYWEAALGIPTVEADSYDIRRSRVLSARRGFGNFSAGLIKNVCEAFSGGEVAVSFNVATGTVGVKFIGTRGIPANLDDLKAAVDNIIHAHLGAEYSFTYLLWSELDQASVTWDQLDAMGMTWDEFETWQPA